MTALLEVALFLGLGRLLVSVGRLSRDTPSALTSWVLYIAWPAAALQSAPSVRLDGALLGGVAWLWACSLSPWWRSSLPFLVSACGAPPRVPCCSRAARQHGRLCAAFHRALLRRSLPCAGDRAFGARRRASVQRAWR